MNDCCRLRQRLLARRQVARLHDEPLHHAVEAHAVVDTGLRQPQEVAHVGGRLVRGERHGDVAGRGLEHRLILRQFLDRFG